MPIPPRKEPLLPFSLTSLKDGLHALEARPIVDLHKRNMLLLARGSDPSLDLDRCVGFC